MCVVCRCECGRSEVEPGVFLNHSLSFLKTILSMKWKLIHQDGEGCPVRFRVPSASVLTPISVGTIQVHTTGSLLLPVLWASNSGPYPCTVSTKQSSQPQSRFCLFVCFVLFFETVFLCATVLAVLELTL